MDGLIPLLQLLITLKLIGVIVGLGALAVWIVLSVIQIIRRD